MNWGKCNVAMNVVIIGLLAACCYQLARSHRTRSRDAWMVEEIRRIERRIDRHIAGNHENEIAPQTAGGQEGL